MTNSKSKYASAYNSCGIWELWHEKTWEEYTNKEYSKIIKGFVDNEVEHNVILYGNNGTGKSMLMNLAMKDLMHKGYSVYSIDFRHLIKEYLKSWRDTGKLGTIVGAEYLAIDDLGKEFNSGEVSKELAITTLDYVLRYRFQRKLSTWLTFNMPLGEIKVEYNEHIASLLKRSSVAICFEGDDFGEQLFKVINPNGKG